MELTELRERIDRIDADLVRLFTERMALSGQVAEYKKEHSLPALDASRERQKLAAVRAAAGEQFAQRFDFFKRERCCHRQFLFRWRPGRPISDCCS